MEKTDFCLEERELTLDDIKKALNRYEQKYKMTSKEFYKKWQQGETDLVAESVEWISFVEAYQVMNGRDSFDKAA